MYIAWKHVRANRVWIPIAVTIMLCVALAPLPWWYYTVLRIAVSLACLALMAHEVAQRGGGWALAFMVLLFVFNPTDPLHFSNRVWGFIDGLAVVAFSAYALTAYKEKRRASLNASK